MAREKKAKSRSCKAVSKAEEIRALDDATINKNIASLKQELFNLRFQAAVGKLENTAQIKKTRKQIARMKTVLTERKLEEARK